MMRLYLARVHAGRVRLDESCDLMEGELLELVPLEDVRNEVAFDAQLLRDLNAPDAPTDMDRLKTTISWISETRNALVPALTNLRMIRESEIATPGSAVDIQMARVESAIDRVMVYTAKVAASIRRSGAG